MLIRAAVIQRLDWGRRIHPQAHSHGCWQRSWFLSTWAPSWCNTAPAFSFFPPGGERGRERSGGGGGGETKNTQKGRCSVFYNLIEKWHTITFAILCLWHHRPTMIWCGRRLCTRGKWVIGSHLEVSYHDTKWDI